MKVQAIEGGASQELLSFMGRVIVHDGTVNELEFLFPKWREGQVRFVEVTLVSNDGGYHLQDGRPTMWLRDHPDMDTVRWPLREEDFVQLRGVSREQEHRLIAAGVQRAAEQAPPEARRR